MTHTLLVRTFLYGLLTPIGVAVAQDNPFLENSEKPSPVAEVVAGQKLLDAELSIDFIERPEDNGGNLFLVGFEAVDEFSRPLENTRPADFQQLGVWIKTWPHTQNVKLVDSLHYCVLYGYSEYPSPQDLSSIAVHTDAMENGVLRLTLEQTVRGRGPSGSTQGEAPANVERVVEKIPEEIQDTPTEIAVQFSPPPEEWGGSLFLTGFEEIDEAMSLPLRGAEPIHFQVLQGDVTSPSVTASVPVVPGLGYLVIYGQGIHPESGDRMSLATVYEEGNTLQFEIGAQLAGTPPKEVLEKPGLEADEGDSAPAEVTQSEPEPSKKSSKILLGLAVGFLGLLGGWWIQRKGSSGPTTSRLERVGESEDDS